MTAAEITDGMRESISKNLDVDAFHRIVEEGLRRPPPGFNPDTFFESVLWELSLWYGLAVGELHDGADLEWAARIYGHTERCKALFLTQFSREWLQYRIRKIRESKQLQDRS